MAQTETEAETEAETETETETDVGNDTGDGRHARRSASREKIVQAFKELVREGASSPGAKEVAERAGVGLRTVYRCFEDMETLYRELIPALHGEFLPYLLPPMRTPVRRERLDAILHNRSWVYSEAEPVLFASERHRYSYAALENDYAFLMRVERERLSEFLNPDDALDGAIFEALAAITSFDFWRRLRREQGLDQEQAKAAMAQAAHAVLATAQVAPDLAVTD